VAKLNIIRASAGSGKTYTLTEEYLKLALRDTDSFRHILAVTFTNKATAEMKNRIVGELYRLSGGRESKHLQPLIAALGIPETELRARAASVLQKILHAYSRFSVSTIDSFFQQIIRSFTREIGIQGGYTIELDTESVLDESIDRLQAETARNKTLLRWLTDFATDKIEKGYSWSFRKDITKLGQQLFNEHFKIFSQSLSEKLADKEFMIAYQRDLTAILKKFESTLGRLASGGTDKIRSAGLETEDFYRGNTGPAGYILKTSTGIIAEPNSYVRKAAESTEGWHIKNAPRKADIEKLCREGLMEILQEMTAYYYREIGNYNTAGQILKNLYTLGILAELSDHMQDYCRENNIFLLSDASSFLNTIIDNNDAPFVYEKTGNHFHHFMIDEFQDTSQLQWNNFKPLISNSLSQNYDNLIVGDVKQSIYRWRNSNWEILASAVGNEFYEQSLAFRTLDHNHRSREKIIQFNNSFFASASRLLQDHFNLQAGEAGISLPENLRQTVNRNFADAVQLPGKPENTGGLARVSFLETDDYDARMEEQLVLLIREIMDNGYAAGDIAVLTRKNDEAKKITDFLLSLTHSPEAKPDFDVISDETLFLSNSPAVCFLMGILKYFHSPEDAINRYFIINEYLTGLPAGEEKAKYREFIETADAEAVSPSALFPEAFQRLHENAGNYSVFELVENMIAVFKFDALKGESVYLQGFQDLILDFTHSQSSSVGDFIRFWEERGYRKPVSLPGNPDAVRVLTMHKAKGLEFPVVIIPYCNWSLADQRNRSILWCTPEKPPFDRLPVVPLDFTSRLAATHFAGAYFEELLKQYVDTINLLYVAFTRAADALYCFSPKPSKDQLTDVSGLLMNVFMKEEPPAGTVTLIPLCTHYRKSDRIFEYGELPAVKDGRHPPADVRWITNDYPVNHARDNLKIAFQGKIFLDAETGKISRPVSEGSLMHEIFSRIIHLGDIPEVVSGLAAEGKITAGEAEKKSLSVQSLFNDTQVAGWFVRDWKVGTETEFILPGGSTRRPDRVLTKGDKAIVIDYKFGKTMEEIHKTQVLEYRQLLLDMGYKQAEAWLWYVMLKKVVQVKEGLKI
jgi:ATP-dependent helicase/nuclease subunit A